MKILAITKQRLLLAVAAVLTVGMVSGLALRPSPMANAQAREGTSYFLKIDGIEGESTNARHVGEIEVDSFSWGLKQEGSSTGGGGGAGKVQMQDFHFSQQVSKASPQIMKACASGKHFKEATLTVSRRGDRNQQKYITVKLSDVMISSYQIAGKEDNTPRDEFTLNAGSVEFSYVPQNKDGSAGTPVVGTAGDMRDL